MLWVASAFPERRAGMADNNCAKAVAEAIAADMK
jgi:hypothetical protein